MTVIHGAGVHYFGEELGSNYQSLGKSEHVIYLALEHRYVSVFLILKQMIFSWATNYLESCPRSCEPIFCENFFLADEHEGGG